MPREIKVIVDNLTGSEFQLLGEWFLGSSGFKSNNCRVEQFETTAVLHFAAPSGSLGGVVRFWEVFPHLRIIFSI